MSDLIVDFPQDARRRVGHKAKRRPSSIRFAAPERGGPSRPRVCFANEKEILFVEDLTFKHKEDLWFSSRELKAFKYHTALSLKQIEATAPSMAQFAWTNVQDTSAFLGLEGYLHKSTPHEICRRRRAVLRAVLGEQARQVEAGIWDPEEMTRAVQAESALSLKRAHLIALIHADKRDG